MEKSELLISGIVCDNPKCSFADHSVKFEDYPKYLNKPCPRCSSNLLTEKDYNRCLKMKRAVEKLNKIEKYFSFTYLFNSIKSIFKKE